MYAWGHAVCSTVIKVLQVNRSGQADYSALVKEEWAVSKELAAAQIAAEKADEAVASIRRQQAAVAKLRNDIKSARHAVATTLDIGGSGNKVRSNSKSSKRQGGNRAAANAITTGAGASQATQQLPIGHGAAGLDATMTITKIITTMHMHGVCF